MALKFRRGTTAQQSGSLAFGEPFVNTTLGTLLVGGPNGDIVLSSAGTGSTGNFGAISGSGLDITGNITLTGNVDGVDISVLNTNINSTTASLNTSIANLNTFSGSQLTQNSTLATVTASYDGRFTTLATYTGSVNTRFTEIGVVSGSLIASASAAKTTNDSQGVSITNLNSATASLLIETANLESFTSSINTTIKSKLDADGVISGSSQLSGTTITNLTITNLTTVNQTASVLFSSGSNKFGDFGDDIHDFTGSVKISGSIVTIGASTATSFNGTINATNGVVSGSSQILGGSGLVSGSSQVTLQSTTGFTTYDTALATITGSLISSASAAKTTNDSQGVSITNLNTTTASLLIETANLETFSGSALTRLSALEVETANLETFSGSALTRLTALEVETANLESFSSSALTRLSNLEGTDITITLTGDVTGTGTITNLGNVSFATTVAANQVALGTDTTGDYVASLVQGTGVTITNNSGEGATPTIAIGQAVATSSNVQFNSLGVGMAASATAGRIDATNDVVAFSSSDIRFKENIKPIENAIDKIRKISGNTYDWKEENKVEHGYEGNDVGVIAQEIEAVLPQLVQTRESGFKAVKYDKLVALLIEGIKEQQLQIEQLRIDLNNCRNNKGL